MQNVLAYAGAGWMGTGTGTHPGHKLRCRAVASNAVFRYDDEIRTSLWSARISPLGSVSVCVDRGLVRTCLRLWPVDGVEFERLALHGDDRSGPCEMFTQPRPRCLDGCAPCLCLAVDAQQEFLRRFAWQWLGFAGDAAFTFLAEPAYMLPGIPGGAVCVPATHEAIDGEGWLRLYGFGPHGDLKHVAQGVPIDAEHCSRFWWCLENRS